MKVAVLNPTFAEALTLGPDSLRSSPVLDLDTRPELITSSREDLRSLAAQAEAIILPSNVPGFPERDDLAYLPELRFVGIGASGYEQYDLAAMADRGIRVVNSRTVSSALSVAEHAVAMTFAVLRRWPEQLAAQERGESYRQVGRLLAGLRVGVVGYGSIGRHAARLFRALGASVVVVSRRGAEAGVEEGLAVLTEIDEALPQLDVVSLHSRLEPETRHLLDRRRLALLPAGASVVNTARQELIDEAALADMLRGGMLGGAALDDLPRNAELLRAPNCLVFNHLGNRSSDGMTSVVRGIFDDLIALATGARPINEIQVASAPPRMTSFPSPKN